MPLFSLSLDSRGPSRPTVRLLAVDPFSLRTFFFFSSSYQGFFCGACHTRRAVEMGGRKLVREFKSNRGAEGHYVCKDGPKRGQSGGTNISRDVTDVTDS